MTTSWSRGPLRPLRSSADNVKTLHQLSKCCCWRCRSVIHCLRLDDSQNPQFGGAVLLISVTEGVGWILPSQLSQFVELHLLLPNSLHALLDLLVIVPITQPGSSSSLTLPCSISSSSSCSPSSPSSELARSLRLSQIPTNISSNVFSGALDVNPAISACMISSCSC
jgi:hypothetical protein